jgi:hypothetical protein
MHTFQWVLNIISVTCEGYAYADEQTRKCIRNTNIPQGKLKLYGIQQDKVDNPTTEVIWVLAYNNLLLGFSDGVSYRNHLLPRQNHLSREIWDSSPAQETMEYLVCIMFVKWR